VCDRRHAARAAGGERGGRRARRQAVGRVRCAGLFFFKQKTAYELGLGIPAEPLFRSVERPVKAAELFAFTLRVRAGNTDVLTDAEENVRQKLRAEGVM